MKILVAIKLVAALDEDFEIREDGCDADPDYLDYQLNEWDDYSWEVALQLAEKFPDKIEAIPVTVGPERAEAGLRKCLAKGGERGIRVWDESLEGSDPMVIGHLLAAVAKREQATMVLAGTLASDHAYAQTGMCAAAELGWAHIAVVSRLDLDPEASEANVRRELEGGIEEELAIQLPAVMTIQLGINEPRYASLRGIKQAKAKPLETLTPSELGLSPQEVGEAGSLSQVRRMYIPEKGQAELIEGTPAEQATRLAEIIKELRGDA